MGSLSIWFLLIYSTLQEGNEQWISILTTFVISSFFAVALLFLRRGGCIWFLVGMVVALTLIGDQEENQFWATEKSEAHTAPLIIEQVQKSPWGKWTISAQGFEGKRWQLDSKEEIKLPVGEWIDVEWKPKKLNPEKHRDRMRASRAYYGQIPHRGEFIDWEELDIEAHIGFQKRAMSRWIGWRSNILLKSEKKLTQIMGENVGGAALAVLLGERKGLDEELSQNLRNAGTFHLFAISGMHLAILSNLLLVLLRAFGLGAKSSSLTLILLLWVYAFLCGLPISVQRACMMASASLVGPWFSRKSAPLHSLCFAGWIILLTRPMEFGNPAFLLSFGATAGIILWNSRENNSKILPDNPLTAPVTISLAAFIFTLPILIHFFHQANLWTLLANLPSCSLMSLFFGAALSSALVPRDYSAITNILSDLFVSASHLLYNAMAKIAKIASEAPSGTASWEAWPIWIAILWYLTFISFSYWGRLRTARVLGLLSTSIMLSYWAFTPIWNRLNPELTVDVIDIGQGDAILIKTPNGRTLLVDTGPGSYGEGARLVNHLKARGGRPDLLLITHPHADHWGGVAFLAENNLLPSKIILPKGETRRKSKGWESTKELLLASKAQIEIAGSGQIVLDSHLKIDLHQPGFQKKPLQNPNDLSLVLDIRWNEQGILFTGDLENQPEVDFALRHSPPAQLKLFKAGHHGSANATQELFLDDWKPEEIVISCGQPNRYQHPTPEMMGRAIRRKIPLRRTDEEGTIQYKWRLND